MLKRSLPDHWVLARTASGDCMMRTRAAELAPKLRAVLFLVDGNQSARKILGHAGNLRELLESQLVELIDLGLVEPLGGHATPGAAVCVEPGANTSAPLVPPLVGAKMQILSQLEELDAEKARSFGAELIDTRSWRDLAAKTKDIAIRLSDIIDAEAGLAFWTRSKVILVAWRSKDIPARRQ
jgi:hypothetical protein